MKLNVRILLGEILQHTPKVGLIAAAIVFLWRLGCSFGIVPGASLFSRGYAVFILLAICAAALTVIAAFARKRLLTREGAALWLDDRLQAKGIFSAALTCLGDGFTNDFSGHILDDALRACKEQVPAQKKLFPGRILFRRGTHSPVGNDVRGHSDFRVESPIRRACTNGRSE